ncbi:MAG: DUF1385 domain-containing protein [Anaerolineaceae bacterium]
MKERLPSYGGQAVIEGVLMRGASNVSMAMRAPDGQVVIHSEPLTGIYTSKITKIPFLRGLVLLWDSLGLGMRLLTISANTQTGEDEKLEGASLYLTLALSITLAVALFFVAPAAIGQFVEKTLGWTAFAGNVVEGLVRLLFLIAYVWGIGFMPDIRRVFAYHGAEHKTINAFEAGADLTPESVARFSVEHPRCGTAFLLTLVVLSIIVFSLMGPMPTVWRLVSRVILLPVLGGIAYEYLRWTANHLEWGIVKILVKPNLALQHLTTREPSLDMLEISIAAFKDMISKETGTVV